MDMDILNTVREKVADITSAAVAQGNKIAFTVKTNFTISERESEVNKLFKETGKLVYEAYCESSEFPTDQLAKLYAQIDMLRAEIAEHKARLNESKNLKVCSSCGESISNESNYCPKCGTKA